MGTCVRTSVAVGEREAGPKAQTQTTRQVFLEWEPVWPWVRDWAQSVNSDDIQKYVYCCRSIISCSKKQNGNCTLSRSRPCDPGTSVHLSFNLGPPPLLPAIPTPFFLSILAFVTVALDCSLFFLASSKPPPARPPEGVGARRASKLIHSGGTRRLLFAQSFLPVKELEKSLVLTVAHGHSS